MKTLITHPLSQIKVAIDFSGKLTISLPGGKQYEGKLTAEETEQLAFRVHEASNGEVSFDPLPTNFLALHVADIRTLEQQAEALELLRVSVAALYDEKSRIDQEKTILDSRLTDCEQDLAAARTALRESRVLVSELNEQLHIASGKSSIRPAGTKPDETKEPTVHNERTSISPDSPEVHIPELIAAQSSL